MTGNELRTFRLKANLTQTEAAERLGVSPGSLSRAEGQLDRRVSGKVAEALAARPDWYLVPGMSKTDGVQTSIPLNLDDGPTLSLLIRALINIGDELRLLREAVTGGALPRVEEVEPSEPIAPIPLDAILPEAAGEPQSDDEVLADEDIPEEENAQEEPAPPQEEPDDGIPDPEEDAVPSEPIDYATPAGIWKCERCGEVHDAELLSPRWRWNGEAWEHRCDDVDPQAGHFSAKEITPEWSDFEKSQQEELR